MTWLLRFSRHAALILTAAAIIVLLFASIKPATVLAPAAISPEIQASWNALRSLEDFGGEREGNYCPVLFGGVSVRPERMVLVQFRRAESEMRRSRFVADILNKHDGGRLYAAMDMTTGTAYITDLFIGLDRRLQLATLFHEVRGHWELRLSDLQMKSVLCPGTDEQDTHCISVEILHGCRRLRGLTTERVYEIMLASGPMLPE